MKKFFIINCLFLGLASTATSQIHLDVKVGMSPASNPVTSPILVNRDKPKEEFQMSMNHVKPQFYGGLALNVQLANAFFLEGGISYTKRSSDYLIRHTYGRDGKPELESMHESEDMILLPLNIGVSLGSFDITSGLKVMKTISKTTELSHIKGFNTNDSSLKMGWQMGIRYGIHRTMVGIEYQGSLTRVGQGMSVNGHSLEVMNVPGNFAFTIQQRF